MLPAFVAIFFVLVAILPALVAIFLVFVAILPALVAILVAFVLILPALVAISPAFLAIFPAFVTISALAFVISPCNVVIFPSAVVKRVSIPAILLISAFAASVKSTVYSRSPLSLSVPPVTDTLPPVAAFTVVSRPFTVYVVTLSFVSVPIVTLLPATTLTAPCAASVIAFLPAVVKLLKSWFAALSIALRVSLSKPIFTTPSTSVEIAIPFLVTTPSVVAVGLVAVVVPPVGFVPSAAGALGTTVPVPATKLNPSANLTEFAVAFSALFARYLMDASKFLATTLLSPKSTVAGLAGIVTSPVVGSVTAGFAGFNVIVASPFLTTKSVLPSPAISLMFARFSANFTSNPSPAVFFTTSMLFLAPSVRVKFSAPFTFKVSPKFRCTLSVSAVSLLP